MSFNNTSLNKIFLIAIAFCAMFFAQNLLLSDAKAGINGSSCWDANDCFDIYHCFPSYPAPYSSPNRAAPGVCRCPQQNENILRWRYIRCDGSQQTELGETIPNLIVGDRINPVLLTINSAQTPQNVNLRTYFRLFGPGNQMFYNFENNNNIYTINRQGDWTVEYYDSAFPPFCFPSNPLSSRNAAYGRVVSSSTVTAKRTRGNINNGSCYRNAQGNCVTDGPNECGVDFNNPIPCNDNACCSTEFVDSGSCSIINGSCQKPQSNQCGQTQYVPCNANLCCAASPPAAPLLSSPADNAVINDTTPLLIWNHSAWGNSCPTNDPANRSYQLRWKPQDANGSCSTSTGSWTNQVVSANSNQYNLSSSQELQSNQTYCWYVTAVNTPNQVSSSVWRFTIARDPYFMTYGGDMYVGGNLSSDIISGISNASTPSQIDLNMNPTANPRLTRIRNELKALQPNLSSNLFLTNSSSQFQRSSKINAQLRFTDNTYQEYSLSHGYDNLTFSNSLYHFFKERLTNDQSNQIVNVTQNSYAFTPQSGNDLRRVLGNSVTAASDRSQKLVVNLSNSTRSTNIVPDSRLISSTTNISQKGVTYGSAIFHARGEDDWSSIRPASPTQTLVCDSKTIFLIQGNLTISTDIINSNSQSSCVFIVEGHLTILMPDIYTATAGSTSYPTNYRLIEGLFIANSYSVKARDDQGALIVNGSIITHESSNVALSTDHINGTNRHDVQTENLNRPQDLYIFDPRHLTFWSSEFQGNLSKPNVREERYLQLVKD